MNWIIVPEICRSNNCKYWIVTKYQKNTNLIKNNRYLTWVIEAFVRLFSQFSDKWTPTFVLCFAFIFFPSLKRTIEEKRQRKKGKMADIDVLVQTQSNSDDSDYDANCSNSIPELKGYLSKWTNYIHGWQPRFIVLKDGTLSYYKRYFGGQRDPERAMNFNWHISIISQWIRERLWMQRSHKSW